MSIFGSEHASNWANAALTLVIGSILKEMLGKLLEKCNEMLTILREKKCSEYQKRNAENIMREMKRNAENIVREMKRNAKNIMNITFVFTKIWQQTKDAL